MEVIMFIGDRAGKLISTGNQNVFVGKDAGDTVTTGSQCIAVGCNADPGNSGPTIVIGMMLLVKGKIQHLLLVQVVHIMELIQQLGHKFQILE